MFSFTNIYKRESRETIWCNCIATQHNARGFASNTTCVRSLTWPHELTKLVTVLRVIHLLDARLSNGWVKYKCDRIPSWRNINMENIAHLQEIWNDWNPYNKATVLVAFFRRIRRMWYMAFSKWQRCVGASRPKILPRASPPYMIEVVVWSWSLNSWLAEDLTKVLSALAIVDVNVLG